MSYEPWANKRPAMSLHPQFPGHGINVITHSRGIRLMEFGRRDDDVHPSPGKSPCGICPSFFALIGRDVGGIARFPIHGLDQFFMNVENVSCVCIESDDNADPPVVDFGAHRVFSYSLPVVDDMDRVDVGVVR
jgi:hypothetical protein